MLELDYKESWALKNWCFWAVVLEKTLESPLDYKKIQPVHPKGNQSWMFIGRTDVEAETPILWPPDVKSWLIGKDPDAGKDRGQEEKGTTEDEMFGWHHWLDGHEFGWTPGVGGRRGGLVFCSPWDRKELDMTERLNWTELKRISSLSLIFTIGDSFTTWSKTACILKVGSFSLMEIGRGVALFLDAYISKVWFQVLKKDIPGL